MGDGNEKTLWWLGLLIALSGAIVSGVGENLVRRSFLQANETRSRNWCLFIFGWVWVFSIDTSSTVGALAFCSPALVAPTGGLHIVSVAVFAHLINKEALCKWDVVGTLLILIGVTGVSLLGPRDTTPSIDQEQIRTRFAILAGASVVLLAATGMLAKAAGKHSSARMRCVFATALGGIFGSLARVTLKATMLILKNADCDDLADSQCVLHDYRMYFTIVSLGVQLAAQLFFVNWALARFEAVAVIPLYSAMLACLSMVASILIFGEWRLLKVYSYALLPISVAVVAVGMWMMSLRTTETGPNIEVGDQEVEADLEAAYEPLVGPAACGPNLDCGCMTVETGLVRIN